VRRAGRRRAALSFEVTRIDAAPRDIRVHAQPPLAYDQAPLESAEECAMVTLRTVVFLAAAAAGVLPAFELAAQDRVAEGQRIFRTRCGSCHSVEPGQHRAGPSLAGIVGAKAGTAEGARHSQAMQNSGIVWNEQTLDAYLANPRQAVPGTTMTVSMPNANERAAVIAYLGTLGSRAN
jgi:cytochrome c